MVWLLGKRRRQKKPLAWRCLVFLDRKASARGGRYREEASLTHPRKRGAPWNVEDCAGMNQGWQGSLVLERMRLLLPQDCSMSDKAPDHIFKLVTDRHSGKMIINIIHAQILHLLPRSWLVGNLNGPCAVLIYQSRLTDMHSLQPSVA